jgi:hypothetical protein
VMIARFSIFRDLGFWDLWRLGFCEVAFVDISGFVDLWNWEFCNSRIWELGHSIHRRLAWQHTIKFSN